ncbi:MAG: ankyrin repeat domain-containing protein [Limisphaerales bacterium]
MQAPEAPETKAAGTKKLEETQISAAWEGEVEKLKAFINGGGNINATGPNGNTMLNLSSVTGKKEVASYLITQGADLELRNNEKNTALFTAAFFCHPEIVTQLISKGADVNAKDKNGSTPLDVATAPWSPELNGIYKFIDGLLKLDLDLERIQKTRGTIAKILTENGGKKAAEL